MNHKRQYGIDLLRVLSMFYIVVLHYCIFGGFSDAVDVQGGTAACILKDAISLLVVCAVNCFGLISGYVGYSDTPKPHRWSTWLMLWLEVVCYQFFIYVMYGALFSGDVQRRDLLGAFFPLFSNTYWYFTAYTGVFLLMPVLNAGIRSCSKGNLLCASALITAMFTFSSLWNDPFRLGGGYSFAWLLVLYLLGAAVRRSGIVGKISPSAAFGGILLVLGFRLLWSHCAPSVTVYMMRLTPAVPESYIAPSTLLLSLLHLLAFGGMKISSQTIRRFLSFAAPGSFAIYILNTHPVLWSYFVAGSMTALPGGVWAAFGRLLGCSVLFVLAALTVDAIRQRLFHILRLRSVAEKAVELVGRISSRYLPE